MRGGGRCRGAGAAVDAKQGWVLEALGGGGGEVRGVGGCDVVEGTGLAGFEVGGESLEAGKAVLDGHL